MTYNIIELEQGSPEWLCYRISRIGGSDASVIMGENPWKTPTQLYEEKKGLRKVYINDAMKRGTKLEPHARSMYERTHNTMIEPAVIVSVEHPRLMASLDGFSHQAILEIKCPGEKTHAIAKEGSIPTYYNAQLQHAMMISGYKSATYMSYLNDDDFCFLTCNRDDKYINKLLEKELEFLGWMEKGLLPPKEQEESMSEQDAELLVLYKNAASKKMIWEKTCKELREEIIQKFQRPVKFKGVTLSERILPGRVDYDNIPELQNVDLNKYRKPETKSWVLSTNE